MAANPLLLCGTWSRDRTGTSLRTQDFKSWASTNSAIQAGCSRLRGRGGFGGDNRSWTDLKGFADLCLTAWLCRLLKWSRVVLQVIYPWFTKVSRSAMIVLDMDSLMAENNYSTTINILLMAGNFSSVMGIVSSGTNLFPSEASMVELVDTQSWGGCGRRPWEFDSLCSHHTTFPIVGFPANYLQNWSIDASD